MLLNPTQNIGQTHSKHFLEVQCQKKSSFDEFGRGVCESCEPLGFPTPVATPQPMARMCSLVRQVGNEWVYKWKTSETETNVLS